MLTLVEAISLAGDRTKQNDDASGAHGSFAWVIDGATGAAFLRTLKGMLENPLAIVY